MTSDTPDVLYYTDPSTGVSLVIHVIIVVVARKPVCFGPAYKFYQG